jgi:hypothetical protein
MHDRTRRSLSTIALTLAVAGGSAAAAEAAADFSLSRLICVPVNGFTTRPGDDVRCRFDVTAFSGSADEVTADVTLPTGLIYDTSLPTNFSGTLDTSSVPARVRYGTSILGFFSEGFTKVATMLLHIADDGSMSPGDPIAPVATVRSPTSADATITADPLFVTPAPAVLKPSTLDCADLSDPPLRPGDLVECSLQLANEPKKEDAIDVVVQVPIPANASWAPGGNETAHSASSIAWAPSALPAGVPSGPRSAPVLRFRLAVADVPGGSKVFAYASVAYNNALSHALGSHAVLGPQLVVAPGPAVLTSSTLACADADGGPLYAGDTLRCAITVADAAGREDIADVTATAPVPPSVVAVGEGSATSLTFGPPAFGMIAAGASKAVSYTLRVDAGAAPGTTITPTASVLGRSVGTDVTVRHELAAVRLVVSARPRPAAAIAPATMSAAAAAALGRPIAAAAGSRICGSRRVVVVNVKPPRGKRWKSVSVSFAKKTVRGKKTGRTGSFRARLVFQGLPKGALEVSIKGVTTKGRMVRSSRTYNLCVKKS